MNKLFIGLLIVAAGAGVFFLLRKKKNSTTANTINKEWIIGKWKAPSDNDSTGQYRYDFQKDGNLLISPNDSAKADTFHYEWSKHNDLVWKETAADTAREVFSIVKLTQDSLQVRSKDSVVTLFIKLK